MMRKLFVSLANSSFFAPEFFSILVNDLSCVFLHFSRKTSHTYFFFLQVWTIPQTTFSRTRTFQHGSLFENFGLEEGAPQKGLLEVYQEGQRGERGSISCPDSLLFLPLFAKWCLDVGILGPTAVLGLLCSLSGSPQTYSENCRFSEHVMIGWLCWKRYWLFPRKASLGSNSGGTDGLLALGDTLTRAWGDAKPAGGVTAKGLRRAAYSGYRKCDFPNDSCIGGLGNEHASHTEMES